MTDSKANKNIIEAALFASHDPLTLQELANLFENKKLSKNKIREIIEDLNKDYADRAFEVSMVASGYRIQIREGYDEWLSKLNNMPSNRYSKAFLETLVIIAYRQPVTRGDIENIRGVSVNPHNIRGLIEREWFKVVGHKETPGKPELLATTKKFLDYFNLKKLSELPVIKEEESL